MELRELQEDALRAEEGFLKGRHDWRNGLFKQA